MKTSHRTFLVTLCASLVFVATVFLTSFAFAETGAPDSPVDTVDIPLLDSPHGILSQVLAALLPVLLAGLVWLGRRVDVWIAQKTDNEMLEGVLIWMDHLVFSVVKEFAQAVVPAYRTAAADGKLSKSEATEIRQLAIDTIKKRMGLKGMAKAAKLGLAGDAFDQLLGTRVEAAVHDLKLADRAAGMMNGRVHAASGGT